MLNQKLICVILATVALPFYAFAQKQHEAYLDYIDYYKDLAVAEMERAGIPASIKLAQGLLESNAGRSDLAVKAYNHFGIKCGSKWTGGTFKKFDDERNAFGMRVKSCFRRFDSAHDSYVAHSDFLLNASSRYGFLFELDPTDYKGWARGLKKAGYATSSDYHRKLISLIDQYELHQYDRLSSAELLAAGGGRRSKENETFGTSITPSASSSESTAASREDRSMKTLEFLYNNDVKYVETPTSQSVSQLAEQVSVPLRSILKYNENLLTAEQLLAPGTRVYVQPKRKNYRGRESMHTVAKGESMMDISIRYGISLSKLYHRNRITPGTEPVAGAEVKLKGRPLAQSPTTYKPRERLAREYTPARVIAADGETEALDMEIEGNAKYQDTRSTTPEAEAQFKNDPFSYPRPQVTGNSSKPAVESPAVILGNPKPEITAANSPEKPAATQPAIFHVVKDGDTLWGISTRYNTTVDKIMEINGLTDSFLLRGMKIRVQ